MLVYRLDVDNGAGLETDKAIDEGVSEWIHILRGVRRIDQRSLGNLEIRNWIRFEIRRPCRELDAFSLCDQRSELRAGARKVCREIRDVLERGLSRQSKNHASISTSELDDGGRGQLRL